MLKAYVDDSSINQGPAYILAGVLADGATWASFSIEWDQALRMSPRVEYFKFEHANNFNGPFNGMSEISRNEKMRLLFNVIREHKIRLYCSFVRRDNFEELYRYVGLPETNNAFLLLYLGLAEFMMQRAHADGLQPPIDFHFDNHPIHAEKINAAWRTLLRANPRRLRQFFRNPPNFHDDKEVLPLQAADFMAGVARQLIFARIAGNPVPRPVWGPIWGSFVFNSQEMTGEMAKQLARGVANTSVIVAAASATFGHIWRVRASSPIEKQ